MDNPQADRVWPGSGPFVPPDQQFIVAEVVAEPPGPDAAPAPPPPRNIALPLTLFLATCLTTFMAGAAGHLAALAQMLPLGLLPDWEFLASLVHDGAAYSIPVMIILAAHEAGHFIQAHRYGVRASLPYFIPMPMPPLGTFGAVIAMDARVPDRRALFDIGISGPLAGLAPTLVFCVWGLHLSKYATPSDGALLFGDPLIFQWLTWLIKGPAGPGEVILVHPFAFAAWVGLLVTSINLLPVGQLDGGHVLYALLRKKARPVAKLVLGGVTVAVVGSAILYGTPQWVLMLFLLFLMGPAHPPTHDDDAPLGPVRVVLGWLTLAFIVVGLTPTPVVM